MKHLISTVLLAIVIQFFSFTVMAKNDVELKIIYTSDVHGNYFPYNFITRKDWSGSLSRVHAYVSLIRQQHGRDNVILLDNGDILQGQPTVYYYNFIDTVSPHICSQIMNYMAYDAATIGNHDIETGHAVYDRWIKECNFPILGANVIDSLTKQPYLPPYSIITRNGVKIAILGLITPAIPAWLPETLWSGLHFRDMKECARQWIDILKVKESPDIVIGLFHSGRHADKGVAGYNENASFTIAQEIPGFDIVLMGHDHQRFCQTTTNVIGDTVIVLNPANNANYIGEITIKATIDNGKITQKKLNGTLTPMNDIEPSPEFLSKFAQQHNNINAFVTRRIGSIDTTISTHHAYFGSSAFVDFIHTMQLDISNADISFAAPLSFDATINAGNILMSDMFNLYKYENMLYVMELTGQEVKDYLEESYSIWTNQMTKASDHLLLLKEVPTGDDKSRAMFVNPSYNFDSAAGLNYTVDVTKPRGNKVHITSMANGDKFDLTKTYRVALNSYRGNGGGELLTKGAGIPKSELNKRIVFSTDKDLRFYLMQYIIEHRQLSPKPLNNWKFVPDDLVIPASERDYKLLFNQ